MGEKMVVWQVAGKAFDYTKKGANIAEDMTPIIGTYKAYADYNLYLNEKQWIAAGIACTATVLSGLSDLCMLTPVGYAAKPEINVAVSSMRNYAAKFATKFAAEAVTPRAGKLLSEAEEAFKLAKPVLKEGKPVLTAQAKEAGERVLALKDPQVARIAEQNLAERAEKELPELIKKEAPKITNASKVTQWFKTRSSAKTFTSANADEEIEKAIQIYTSNKNVARRTLWVSEGYALEVGTRIAETLATREVLQSATRTGLTVEKEAIKEIVDVSVNRALNIAKARGAKTPLLVEGGPVDKIVAEITERITKAVERANLRVSGLPDTRMLSDEVIIQKTKEVFKEELGAGARARLPTPSPTPLKAAETAAEVAKKKPDVRAWGEFKRGVGKGIDALQSDKSIAEQVLERNPMMIRRKYNPLRLGAQAPSWLLDQSLIRTPVQSLLAKPAFAKTSGFRNWLIKPSPLMAPVLPLPLRPIAYTVKKAIERPEFLFSGTSARALGQAAPLGQWSYNKVMGLANAKQKTGSGLGGTFTAELGTQVENVKKQAKKLGLTPEVESALKAWLDKKQPNEIDINELKALNEKLSKERVKDKKIAIICGTLQIPVPGEIQGGAERPVTGTPTGEYK